MPRLVDVGESEQFLGDRRYRIVPSDSLDLFGTEPAACCSLHLHVGNSIRRDRYTSVLTKSRSRLLCSCSMQPRIRTLCEAKN